MELGVRKVYWETAYSKWSLRRWEGQPGCVAAPTTVKERGTQGGWVECLQPWHCSRTGLIRPQRSPQIKISLWRVPSLAGMGCLSIPTRQSHKIGAAHKKCGPSWMWWQIQKSRSWVEGPSASCSKRCEQWVFTVIPSLKTSTHDVLQSLFTHETQKH